MKTNIDINKDFTMADIISKEFVFYVRDYIKELEKEQKITKRDRKDTHHPCPEERKYSPSEAEYKARFNRYRLRDLNVVYYFMKKNKDFDWSSIKIQYKEWHWKKPKKLFANDLHEVDIKQYNYGFVPFHQLTVEGEYNILTKDGYFTKFPESSIIRDYINKLNNGK